MLAYILPIGFKFTNRIYVMKLFKIFMLLLGLSSQCNATIVKFDIGGAGGYGFWLTYADTNFSPYDEQLISVSVTYGSTPVTPVETFIGTNIVGNESILTLNSDGDGVISGWFDVLHTNYDFQVRGIPTMPGMVQVMTRNTGQSTVIGEDVVAFNLMDITIPDQLDSQESTIPEPSILALMGLGLIGLFGVNRRKIQA